MTDSVMAGIASIPERVGSLERTLASITPQVDQVFLSLNDYTEEPAFLDDFSNVTATVRRVNAGDAEKFAAVDDWDGYVITIDDDLLYPPDYVETLIAGIERYDRRRACSFHGGTTSGFSARVHGAATLKRLHCLATVAADDLDVNAVGTGVLGWHTAHVPIWRDIFRTPNMADVYLSCHAHRFGIPLAVLAHQQGWLEYILPDGMGTIYDSNAAGDGTFFDTREERRLELETIDWTQPPSRPRVRVSIATCSRPELLLELLEDLARDAVGIDLEVGVYEDPTDVTYESVRAFCEQRGWEWHKFERRLGVRDHYQLVAQELADAKRSKADWFVFLPDDVRLGRNTIARAIDTWHRLDDPATLTLWRLASLEGKTNWTGREAVEHANATEVFHVDGLYLCRRPTLERLGFAVTDPRPAPGFSSGVGRQISVALHRAGARMYRVDRSLVTVNDGGVSIMNPAEREKHPAVAL